MFVPLHEDKKSLCDFILNSSDSQDVIMSNVDIGIDIPTSELGWTMPKRKQWVTSVIFKLSTRLEEVG